ncbi:MAG: fumarylacetoacetate hydrolase family protein [Alphaproteobacteria bacterium]
MKLASLKAGGRDGALVVVSRDLTRAVAVPDVAPTLQAALDDWHALAPELSSIYRLLNQGKQTRAFALDIDALGAPLPRAYQFLDGSAYLAHTERVRRARGASLPENAETDPLMYQGCSHRFLGPRDAVAAASEDWGIDFEAEVAVVTDDTPAGIAADAAGAHVKLVMLLNDVSLRRLIPAELAKGFGFLHGKPPSACSPVAVSPEELGPAWDGARLHLPLRVELNGACFGAPQAGEDMQFDFPALIAHAARTRPLAAGTIIGAGTVANVDAARGYCCILERRAVEIAEHGQATTPFLRFGDRVRIDMRDAQGRSVFGAIEQQVVRHPGAA